MIDMAADLCAQVFSAALPIAIVFEVSNLLASTFLRAAFGGRLWFGA